LTASPASRVLESDDALSRVFIAANEVVVSRAGGWDDDAVATVSDVIAEFFLYY